MIRKSLVSFLVAALVGVGIVAVAAPGPTSVEHLAVPTAKVCGMCPRGL